VQCDDATNDIIEVIDVNLFVVEQRVNARRWKNGLLAKPMERIHRPADAKVAVHIRLNGIEFRSDGVVT